MKLHRNMAIIEMDTTSIDILINDFFRAVHKVWSAEDAASSPAGAAGPGRGARGLPGEHRRALVRSDQL